MKTMRVLACVIALALAVWPTLAKAQDARLTRRLDAQTAAAVTAIVDSARVEGLPSEPLIQKALEGASKDAADAAIVAAVRELRARLAQVSSALDGASNGELVVGAGAIESGARGSDLRRLRPYSGGNLTNAFLGLTFLLQRGVAPENAAGIVASMLEARLSGSDFTTLQRLVDQDIRAGALPSDAARVRSRALILHNSRIPRREEGGT